MTTRKEWKYTKYGICCALHISEATFPRRMKDLSSDSKVLDEFPNFSRYMKNHRILPPKLWRYIILQFADPDQAKLNIISKCNITSEDELEFLEKVFNLSDQVTHAQVTANFALKNPFF